MLKENRGVGEITWIRCRYSGGASKITGALTLTFPLEKAVDSI